MKVLSIIAQKPSSTGSGVYLSELVRCFSELGIEQEVIFAAYKGDEIHFPTGVKCKKVVFDTEKLPLKIAGMSDVMPYESIKYSELAKDDSKLKIWNRAFEDAIDSVLADFKPDLIICHHLYLLTAIVASKVDIPIYGICHNTDLRQYRQTDLKRDFIKENIKKLKKIFVPSIEHAKIINEIFGIDESKVDIIGIGYNDKTFYDKKIRDNSDNVVKLLYVGKVAKKKGVLSLVKAINLLNDEKIVLDIVGGAGDADEYAEILKESSILKSKINFLGSMDHKKLSDVYNAHDIFVLPSFSEGVPMVPIEAMACGCKVVISDLPGVKDFYDNNITNASIKYVRLPNLTNVDNATDEELMSFEKRLAEAIKASVEDKNDYKPILYNITWESIAKKLIG